MFASIMSILDRPEQEKGKKRGFTKQDAQRGYWREDMSESHYSRPGVMWRNISKERTRD